ncbi:MAG: nitroreductase family protein [Anaerolineae bacterium]
MTHPIDDVIRQRRTGKPLRDMARCDDAASIHAEVAAALPEVIETAGYAPYHKLAHESHRQANLTSIVPWRFYPLDKPACCCLLRRLETHAHAHPDSKWSKAWDSKIPKLLAGCSALVLVTWLPDPAPDGSLPLLNENNIEHIAAASAAVQNLLLAATARGWHNYWSTGGILRDADVFAWLGIPANQLLLGAIFLAHPDAPLDAVEGGSLREKRGTPADWSRWVTLT